MRVSRVCSIGLNNPSFKEKNNKDVCVKNIGMKKNVVNSQPIRRPLFK